MSGTVADLVGKVNSWLHRLMPDGPRVEQLTRDLVAEFEDRSEQVTAAACQAVEQVAWRHSRHLELHFGPSGGKTPDEEPRGWPAGDPDQARAGAARITAVRRLPGGACLIVLDGLEPWAVAQPYVDAAFALAHGSSRILLDLRGNGGGDPATVAAIAGRLLGDSAQQLSEVVYRNRRRQWWTADRPAGTALTQDVAVLVGNHTYSSAEALAYHLQVRGRATVVGEPTRGAADHVTPIQLTPHVFGILPEAYVRDAHTGANWEGAGVVPDLRCPAADALEVAAGQADSRMTKVGS
jgi:hypothetical protein